MIIDAWYATAGVVAYAVWSAICVMLAGLALNGYQTDRRVMWLAVLVAATVMALRFAVLSVALGPLVLVDRRQGQLVAWGLDMVGALAALIGIVGYLRWLYRTAPPRTKREKRYVDDLATGME